MVNRNLKATIIITIILLLEIFIIYLMLTGSYTSPLCLEPISNINIGVGLTN